MVLTSVLLSRLVRDASIKDCPRPESKALASMRISVSAESTKFVPKAGIVGVPVNELYALSCLNLTYAESTSLVVLPESRALASIRIKACAESIKSTPRVGIVGAPVREPYVLSCLA